MPNRIKRNSVVELLQKMPVTGTRGSLLTAIDKLLKTIDISESAVMIPTLLRDKCQFDALELLIVAKILKAAILGHSDLVEFYMNHIGLSQASANQAHTPSTPASTPSATTAGSSTTGLASTVSGDLSSTGTAVPSKQYGIERSESETVASTPTLNECSSTDNLSGAWFTAHPNNGLLVASNQQCAVSSTSDSLLSTTTGAVPGSMSAESKFDSLANHLNKSLSVQASELAANEASQRHISNPDSTATVKQQFPAKRQSDPAATQPQSHSLPRPNYTLPLNGGDTCSLSFSASVGKPVHEHLCIQPSLSTPTMDILNNNGSNCSSSLATPTAPSNGAASLLNGQPVQQPVGDDPGASVRLLLQIEHLKSSIQYVTRLLENVVELYKKSVDSIAIG